VTNTLSKEGQFVHGSSLSRRSTRLDNQEEPHAVTRRILAALAVLLLSVSLAACGDDDDGGVVADDAEETTDTSAEGAFPVEIDTSAGPVTIEDRPTRIVSLSPSATETLFAIGAGDQVIAVDENSNFPAEVPKGDLDAYEPNVEAVIEKEPDLVVLSNDANDLIASLEAVEIPVLLEDAPADLDGVLDQVDDLGRATGHLEEAEELATTIREDIEEIVADTEAEGVSYYYELDSSFYSQTSATFLGKLIGDLGLVNIADGAGDGSDYPQLSAEHIIREDPDLILLADTKCCQQSAETVAARPGWAELQAVKAKGVVELDDDIASRWGPRIVDLVRRVADAAEKVKSAA
jgi:iron complex transport system substrate-binding protein